MASIAQAVRRIKENLASYLEPAFIESLCREHGHAWRSRVLDPVTTLHLFILQILQGNTACSHLSHLACQSRKDSAATRRGRSFTASAYCQARRRLPLELIAALVLRFANALQADQKSAHLWHGHRTILLDGSGVSMPDTPELQTHFGQPGGQKKGCGFPVAHLLAIFDAKTGFLFDLIVSPMRTHDMARAREAHTRLRPGDLVLADRGFCSYAHLALILKAEMHACLRMHQRQITSFRPHRRATRKNDKGLPRSRWIHRLGICDQIVEWHKPAKKPGWMAASDFEALPTTLELRELKYKITQRGYRVREVTLVTTLLDAKTYPAADLAELYGMRWQVETNLRHLKTTLGMDVLHCKTVEGVKKELCIFALVYNMVRLAMLESAREKKVDPDRISFIDAMRWLIGAVHDPTGESAARLAHLTVNPHRERIEPRVLKRRPKEFIFMKKPRAQLRQDMMRGKFVA
jgi:hypothetical protein